MPLPPTTRPDLDDTHPAITCRWPETLIVYPNHDNTAYHWGRPSDIEEDIEQEHQPTPFHWDTFITTRNLQPGDTVLIAYTNPHHTCGTTTPNQPHYRSVISYAVDNTTVTDITHPWNQEQHEFETAMNRY